LNKLSTFAPFTIGYYHAIFRFLSKSSKLIGANGKAVDENLENEDDA
jgi:hypothetical protein